MKKLSNSFRKYIEKTNKNDPTAVPIFSGIIIVLFLGIIFLALGFSSSDASFIITLGIFLYAFVLIINGKY